DNATLDGTMREVCRVLTRGGRFIGTVPYQENIERGRVFCPHCQETFHQRGHVQSFSCSRLSGMLSERGFVVRKCYARAFAHWRARTVRGFARAAMRYVL